MQPENLYSPLSPDHMDWASMFPAYVNPDPQKTNLAGSRRLVKNVEIVDIGCGFGGLLMALAPLMPDTLMVGTLNLPFSGHRRCDARAI